MLRQSIFFTFGQLLGTLTSVEILLNWAFLTLLRASQNHASPIFAFWRELDSNITDYIPYTKSFNKISSLGPIVILSYVRISTLSFLCDSSSKFKNGMPVIQRYYQPRRYIWGKNYLLRMSCWSRNGCPQGISATMLAQENSCPWASHRSWMGTPHT